MYARPLGPGAQLTPLEPWQAAEFLANLDRCRERISPWVGRNFVATDLESAEAVLRRYWEAQAKNGGGIHGIRVDGVLVGGVMLFGINRETRTGEVGCWLESSAEGHGLVNRAARLLIDWGFRGLGLDRIVWDTRSDNVRSINTARNLGLTFEKSHAGEHPMEIWSVTGDEWLQQDDEWQIDAIAAEFWDAFTNTDGRTVELDALKPLFLEKALIVTNGGTTKTETLDEFLTPRQELLTSGELTDFKEWETSQTTLVSGDIAQRLAHYAKSGVLRGEPFTGGGRKSIQLVRTADGWKIAGMAWSDGDQH